MLLQQVGYDVRTAHSSEAAMELALEFQPRIVLLDIGLPGMDGYAVARHFRLHSQLKDMGLVAVTGYGKDSDRQRLQGSGI